MSASEQRIDLSRERMELGAGASPLAAVGFSVGVVGLLASVALVLAGEDLIRRALQSYLVSFTFFLSMTLGALFFVLIQHLTRAGWSVVIRRFAEGFAANAWLLAVLSLPILFGMEQLFEWSRADAVAHDHLLQIKRPYLNPVFFVIRMAIYFGAWSLLSQWLFRRSVEQDRTGDPALTTRMQQVSAPAMFLYAITVTFAAFDLLMSLEPRWFSTIFGVYFFSGGVLAFLSVLPMTSFFLQRSGRLTGVISTEHYHDMGKFLFAFVVFWAYIAFSQYMLIWYANIPEETTWYLSRQTGEWTTFSWFLLIGHFLLPFLALISRIPKRRRIGLVVASGWLLFVHYADLYYIVMPHASPGRVPLHPLDLTCFLGIGGLYVGVVALRMRHRSLIPERDPRLGESLAFENF